MEIQSHVGPLVMIPYTCPTNTVAQVTRLPPHVKQVNCNHLQSRLRNFILVAEHIALGNPFGEGPQVKLCFTTSYSSVGAMSILECLKWHNFVQIGEGDPALTTEGKNGIPRYAGDATKLAEYQFRVRLRQVREKSISDERLCLAICSFCLWYLFFFGPLILMFLPSFGGLISCNIQFYSGSKSIMYQAGWPSHR